MRIAILSFIALLLNPTVPLDFSELKTAIKEGGK